MRRFILAAVLAAALPATATAQVADTAPCGTTHKHNWLARQAFRYSVSNGDFVAPAAGKTYIRRTAMMRSCAKHTGQLNKYHAELRFFHRRKSQWRYVHHIDVITTYGKWAVPAYVVMHESGGNFGAVNPNGCGGPGCFGAYQIGVDHWGRVCAGLGRDPAGQHECAYRILHGYGRYPAEGPSAWSTW